MHKKRNLRRGREVLLWTGGFFLLIHVAAILLLEWYGLPIRFPNASDVLVELQQRQCPPDIVCFGSSRFLSAVDPDQAQDQLRKRFRGSAVTVFNAAVPAGDLNTTDFLLERLLKMEIRPKLVVIEITPEEISEENRWLREHLRRQVSLEQLPKYVQPAMHENELGCLVSSFFAPLRMHRYQICKEALRFWREGWDNWRRPYILSARMVLASEPPPQGEAGRVSCRHVLERSGLQIGCLRQWTPVIPLRPDWDPNREVGPQNLPVGPETAKGTANMREWLEHYEIGGLSAAALERILARCHKNGIVPLLVVPALAKSRQEVYTEEIDARFRAHLETVRARFPFGLADFRGCLPDHGLVDSHHLNEEGRKLFTDLLVGRLLEPLWREMNTPAKS